MELNYHHLKYFWAVARAGSLSRGAAEVHVTPQTLSTQIRDLEVVLGETLFDRSGRTLVLTSVGQVVYQYADDIFSIGQELVETLRGQPSQRPLRLVVGVTDVLPKLVAHRLIDPALKLDTPVRVVCREGSQEDLLAELALHRLDVVLSDGPIPAPARIKAYNHLLGECSVTFMASGKTASSYRRRFPRSLDGAPFLLPTNETSLRASLDDWFRKNAIRPKVVAEFQDSALLKVFGQTGVGVFAVPTAIAEAVGQQYRARPIGTADGVRAQFYAISAERRVRHPGVEVICTAAQTELFA